MIGKIITGRSVHRPFLGQRFVTGQNFFDDAVDGTSILGQRNAKRFGATALQFLEILQREIKTVRMVDAQSGDRAGTDKIDQQLVRGGEDFWHFYADSSQIIDVEESSVINLLGCNAPK